MDDDANLNERCRNMLYEHLAARWMPPMWSEPHTLCEWNLQSPIKPGHEYQSLESISSGNARVDITDIPPRGQQASFIVELKSGRVVYWILWCSLFWKSSNTRFGSVTHLLGMLYSNAARLGLRGFI